MVRMTFIALCILSSHVTAHAQRAPAYERERAEREEIQRRRESFREADEERARARGEQGSIFRQREAEEQERARQRDQERDEVSARNRALRESYEREEKERERLLRELQRPR